MFWGMTSNLFNSIMSSVLTAVSWAQELFGKFEKDEDGNVSKEEFIKVLAEDPDIVKYLSTA